MENFLRMKQAEFYFQKINKQPSKREFKIITNILLIESNSLLNYSRINYILLKRKLLMTQTNTLNVF